MEPLTRLATFDQLKILSDTRRLSILRQLMTGPATLSQLGRTLGEEPSWVRHHLKILEAANLVELVDVRVSGGYVEKFYQSKSHAFLFQELLLPETHGKKMAVLSGSHDLAVELLTGTVCGDLEVFNLPVGSLDGLVALRQGMCNATGCHLYDAGSGDFNSSYVRHFFPDKTMVLLTLAHREQGLIVEPGNPSHIKSFEDLTKNVQFINRNRGSGTRIWLDEQLKRLGILPERIRGYKNEARTHTEVADAIQHGRAQAGLGIHAAAVSHQLDFIPLFQERYDLVLPKEQISDQWLSPLFDKFYSGEFRHAVEKLTGYDITHMGDQIIL
jgi:putative molybdopterin biosynthesis protein